MLRFTDIAQAYPETRNAEVRRQDFSEISPLFGAEALAKQASRCSQCGVPFCQVHCPLSNNIPDWLRLAAEGRVREAYEVASATNTFPEICGRICPQDRLCEGNCVIEKDFGAVTIGAVEKTITEIAFEEGWVQPIQAAEETGKSVGIIGAGPAGLAAADMLRRQGHAVTVYDRYDRVGGLMVYGIPSFKLDKAIVRRREQLLREGGVAFVLNCDIGIDVHFAALQKKHDAMLIATGVYKPRALRMPGDTLKGVVPAMDYLTSSNRVGLGDVVEAYAQGLHNAAGKRVVVIGGGDTAMDCVRTAVRQGAASVTCLYRRDRVNMPGSAREVAYAEAEGVTFAWLSAPLAIQGKKQVESITVQRMRLGGNAESGRQQVEVVEGDTYALGADLVIPALGYDPENLPSLWEQPQLRVSESGTLSVGGDYQTALPGVYAAGDIVRGASLVVWAIRDGREAAMAIHKNLTAGVRHVA